MDPRILLRRRIRALVAVCLGGMLAVCYACAPQQGMTLPEDARGWANCTDRPRFFLTEKALESPRVLNSVIAHERAHTAMMASFDSCADYRRWRDQPGNRLTLEALGYCASARSLVRDGMDPDSALAEVSRSLMHPHYDFGLTAEQALRKILAVCP